MSTCSSAVGPLPSRSLGPCPAELTQQEWHRSSCCSSRRSAGRPTPASQLLPGDEPAVKRSSARGRCCQSRALGLRPTRCARVRRELLVRRRPAHPREDLIDHRALCGASCGLRHCAMASRCCIASLAMPIEPERGARFSTRHAGLQGGLPPHAAMGGRSHQVRRSQPLGLDQPAGGCCRRPLGAARAEGARSLSRPPLSPANAASLGNHPAPEQVLLKLQLGEVGESEMFGDVDLGRLHLRDEAVSVNPSLNGPSTSRQAASRVWPLASTAGQGCGDGGHGNAACIGVAPDGSRPARPHTPFGLHVPPQVGDWQGA